MELIRSLTVAVIKTALLKLVKSGSLQEGLESFSQRKGGKFYVNLTLVRIDAPEKSHGKHQPGQPFSQSSTKQLASLVLNKPVDIVSYGTDRYGRTLGVVYVDGKDVNLEMVRAGLAEVYRGRPAKGFDNGPYQGAEDAARRAGVGMWTLGDEYVSPKEWRRMNR